MKKSNILAFLCVGSLLFTLQCTQLFRPGYTPYLIDEEHHTYVEGPQRRRYVDIRAIDSLSPGKIFLQMGAREPLYIKATEELSMKSGWRIQGKTGKEWLIKEQSTTLSAINIKEADDIQIKHFKIRMDTVGPVTHYKGLIEIDNLSALGKGIDIQKMTLENHYAAIWVKRGENISIKNCLIQGNAHQISLGFLLTAPDSIKNYSVKKVRIEDCVIQRSRGGNSNGIHTFSNCRQILIKNNFISHNIQDGIDLYPGGLDVDIIGNTIRDNGIHGIEVKMTNIYAPDQTGQIERVLIEGNTLVNNQNMGIACRDEATDYFPRGVEILENTIDSSGQYGIFTGYPVKITGNSLENNGLKRIPDKTYGYTGIYFYNVRAGDGDSSIVRNNEIINQAPIPGINSAYWMSVNNSRSYITVVRNRFHITPEAPSYPPAKYGISFIGAQGFFNPEEVRNQNHFSENFDKKFYFE